MRAPVAAADLVADQAVARGGIGDAQQRLSEAHQGDAFPRIERELEHQRVDTAGAGARSTHTLRERSGQALRRGERWWSEFRLGKEVSHRGGLVGAIHLGDPRAQRVQRVARGQHERRWIQAVHGIGAVSERMPIAS